MDRREFLAVAVAPLILGPAPAFARSTGGTPLALVTADVESSVVAVDFSAGRVVRRLASRPCCVSRVDSTRVLAGRRLGG